MENTLIVDQTLNGHFSLDFTYTFFLNMCEMNKRFGYYEAKGVIITQFFDAKLT